MRRVQPGRDDRRSGTVRRREVDAQQGADALGHVRRRLVGGDCDVLRLVVAVARVGAPEVFEDGEAGVAVQIGPLQIRIRKNACGLMFGMIGQPALHFLQFACP